jgi:hypothetical protein
MSDYTTCSRCGATIRSEYRICTNCGNIIAKATSRTRPPSTTRTRPATTSAAGTIGPGRIRRKPQLAGPATGRRTGGIGDADAVNRAKRAAAYAKIAKKAATKKTVIKTVKQGPRYPLPGSFDVFGRRYESRGVFFAAIFGIIAAIVTFVLIGRDWVKVMVGGYEMFRTGLISSEMEFLGAFSLNIKLLQFLCGLVFVLLLIGAIVLLILSVVILVKSTLEQSTLALLSIVLIFVLGGFVVIGLAFTVFSALSSSLGVTPYPIILMIVSGLLALGLLYIMGSDEEEDLS